MAIKIVTWRTAVIPNQGLSVQNYLNAHNFQPGKFIVIPGFDTVTIVYAAIEEELQNDVKS